MSNEIRLTKAGLLEAIKDYPDDTPITVDGGRAMHEEIGKSLLGYDERLACVWAVSENPDAIVLEL